MPFGSTGTNLRQDTKMVKEHGGATGDRGATSPVETREFTGMAGHGFLPRRDPLQATLCPTLITEVDFSSARQATTFLAKRPELDHGLVEAELENALSLSNDENAQTAYFHVVLKSKMSFRQTNIRYLALCRENKIAPPPL